MRVATPTPPVKPRPPSAQGDEPDENDTFALLVSLKRIYAFYMSHDLNAWNLWDSLFSIVHAGYESCNIPEQIIKFSIACCNMSILWFLESISSEVPVSTGRSQTGAVNSVRVAVGLSD